MAQSHLVIVCTKITTGCKKKPPTLLPCACITTDKPWVLRTVHVRAVLPSPDVQPMEDLLTNPYIRQNPVALRSPRHCCMRDPHRLVDRAPLLEPVVGGLLGDYDVVDVAFPEARNSNAQETRTLLQFRNRGAAAIAHAGLQTAH